MASLSAFVVGYGDETPNAQGVVRRLVQFDLYPRLCLGLEAGALEMKKFLAVMMLCAISALAAAPQFFIQGSTSRERVRLTRIEQSLNFTKEPMVNYWEVTILSEQEFHRNVEVFKLNTDTAYTYLPLHRTYVNEGYLTYADDQRIRHTLAHEAGHLICECPSEQTANDIAYVLETSR